MREILFRGKSGDKWIYGYYLFVKEQNKHYILTGKIASYSVDCLHSNLKTNGFEWFEVAPETVGQYTGLKDKNGNRIFEGDIILYEEIQKVIVSFENGQFVVNHFAINVLNSRNATSEIIGNIHNNKGEQNGNRC